MPRSIRSRKLSGGGSSYDVPPTNEDSTTSSCSTSERRWEESSIKPQLQSSPPSSSPKSGICFARKHDGVGRESSEGFPRENNETADNSIAPAMDTPATSSHYASNMAEVARSLTMMSSSSSSSLLSSFLSRSDDLTECCSDSDSDNDLLAVSPPFRKEHMNSLEVEWRVENAMKNLNILLWKILIFKGSSWFGE